jgi:hypothetical protein
VKVVVVVVVMMGVVVVVLLLVSGGSGGGGVRSVPFCPVEMIFTTLAGTLDVT